MTIKHITIDQMALYVTNLLTEEERAQVEQQLDACACCLQQLMVVIEATEHETQSPLTITTHLPDMELMEKRVMERLRDELELNPVLIVQEKPRRIRNWLQHPAAQYTIAASITLLLLFSGTFSSFSEKLAQHDREEMVQYEHRPVALGKSTESWSDKIVDQTGSWLDGLKKSRFK